MATLNVSDEQKARVKAAVDLVRENLTIKVSQADVIDIGMALIEKQYGGKQ